MREYFVFDGINTQDYLMYAADKNQFEGGGKRVETIVVPGRNGTLSISDGTYENVTITYEMYCRGDIRNNLAAMRDRLGATSGYRRLADSFEPDVFMKARYVEAFSVKGSDRKGAAIDVSFDCDPRRFLKSGERAMTLTGKSSLRNPTRNEARPLIRAYGTGTLAVGGARMQVTAADAYTDIDSEVEEAYKDSVNCNGNIVLADGRFPVLEAGINEVSFTGFSKIEITPRWWTR